MYVALAAHRKVSHKVQDGLGCISIFVDVFHVVRPKRPWSCSTHSQHPASLNVEAWASFAEVIGGTEICVPDMHGADDILQNWKQIVHCILHPLGTCGKGRRFCWIGLLLNAEFCLLQRRGAFLQSSGACEQGCEGQKHRGVQ